MPSAHRPALRLRRTGEALDLHLGSLGEIADFTTLIYDAREQVFDRLKREAAALGAEEVVGIKTYIIELGTSLVEIFSVGTAVRRQAGVAVATANLPAQAIIRDKGQGYRCGPRSDSQAICNRRSRKGVGFERARRYRQC